MKIKIRIMADDKKKKLLDFIDRKAFDVIINADPKKTVKKIKRSWKISRERQRMKRNSFTKITIMPKK